MAQQAGVQLPSLLPALWQAASVPLAAAQPLATPGAAPTPPEQLLPAVHALHVLRVLAPAMHADLAAQHVPPLLPLVSGCLRSGNAAVQVAAAAALAELCAAHTQHLLPGVLRLLMPLMAGALFPCTLLLPGACTRRLPACRGQPAFASASSGGQVNSRPAPPTASRRRRARRLAAGRHAVHAAPGVSPGSRPGAIPGSSGRAAAAPHERPCARHALASGQGLRGSRGYHAASSGPPALAAALEKRAACLAWLRGRVCWEREAVCRPQQAAPAGCHGGQLRAAGRLAHLLACIGQHPSARYV
jgi:hypothetical protein